MANKMLIDATHPEETRVVVVRGNRVEEFDFESSSRRQLRGNIYLAKVTRVEPSLQAAFVEYGGNRHGFLAFSEIHPDYYQIPVADRQALIAEEERAQREIDDEVDHRRQGRRRGRNRGADRRHERVQSDVVAGDDTASRERHDETADPVIAEAPSEEVVAQATEFSTEAAPSSETGEGEAPRQPEEAETSGEIPLQPAEGDAPEHAEAGVAAGERYETDEDRRTEETSEADADVSAQPDEDEHEHGGENAEHGEDAETGRHGENGDENGEEEEIVESVGGDDALEEATERMPRIRRQYKIQEVIKRRQIMLVQVVKEERGTKGAALTTYLSLAGRYSVLMPNTARGGGISRKITNAVDRKRLKELASELEVPEGMGVILRTAGANRTKAEIKRDFEYLLRLWETVRDLTLNSTAPSLVYEEGSLIKRSIRDLYNKDIDEVLVAGDDAYREAKDFMRTLMPSHAKNVKSYKDNQPVFTRYGIESQLDAMFSPIVQLKSGGYIVLNQAEALVAIDVNSGRATREHHIEDTALKTNCEAADEIARQLRLRDLAGLIVIDFIDMDEKRNNRTVERRLKEALKNDRARIQVGRISHFGLLEMSRQRIRTSVLESSTERCAQCGGTGHVRSVASVTLQLLRSIEELLLKGATHNITVRTRAEVALYVLNHKRAHLHDFETRFRITVTINADPTITGQQPFAIERGEQVHSVEAAKAIAAQQPLSVVPEPEEEPEDVVAADDVVAAEEEPAEDIADSDGGERKRRRRRRGRRGEEREPADLTHEAVAEHRVARSEDDEIAEPREDEAAEGADTEAREPRERNGGEGGDSGDAERRRRRRGRRGGRRNRRDRDGVAGSEDVEAVDAEIAAAVADFDRPQPVAETADGYTPQFPPAEQPQPGEPVAAAAESPIAAEPEPGPPAAPPVPVPAPEPPAAEPYRRRSTVREPAPYLIGSGEAPVAPPPAAAPMPSAESEVVTEQPSAANQPRRTGWWARRLLGGDKQ
jgi:ribonuclease E